MSPVLILINNTMLYQFSPDKKVRPGCAASRFLYFDFLVKNRHFCRKVLEFCGKNHGAAAQGGVS
jgi:hypothetical protein